MVAYSPKILFIKLYNSNLQENVILLFQKLSTQSNPINTTKEVQINLYTTLAMVQVVIFMLPWQMEAIATLIDGETKLNSTSEIHWEIIEERKKYEYFKFRLILKMLMFLQNHRINS